PDKLAAALKISTVPIVEGTVTIAILAESPDPGKPGEFVANLVGVGRVSMTGAERASFMAKLTQDGTVLLWEMVERELPAIRIAYDLKFNHRLNAVSMLVWCHASKTYTFIQEQWQHLSDEASFYEKRSGGWTTVSYDRHESKDAGDVLTRTSLANETSGVQIIPEAGNEAVPPEQIQELTRFGHEMIKDFLAATFLEFKPGTDTTLEQQPELKTELASYGDRKYGQHTIDHYNLKRVNESMVADLNYTFKSKAVLEGHLAPNDNLSNILAGQRVEEFRTQIDIDPEWYQYINVEVVCTADFAEDPVDLVKARLEYHGSGSHGRIDSVKDLVFQKGSLPQFFTTYLAAPDQRGYDFEYEVFYRGTSESLSTRGKSDDTVLVLDTDRLGILRVDVQLGLVDWERMRSVFVKMWYGDGMNVKETEFALDQQRQSHRWAEVIARPVIEAYRYQLTFIDKNNQRIELDPATSRSKQLIVNQPLQEELEVMIVPAGKFGSEGVISQIIVALRYRDPANDYSADDVFALVKDTDTKLWKVPLMDRALRRYEYQVTVLYLDGVTREDEWRATDKAVLAVGDPFDFRVQISPYLLKDRGYQFATIHLVSEDSQAGIRAEKDLEITDFTKPLYWRFRLGSKERHTYRYQLTLFKTDGQAIEVPEREESKELLVLRPPSSV
ncbi:MAG: hypothetical protein ACREV1_08785, partial [Gammaproteobacteria bacterium]